MAMLLYVADDAEGWLEPARQLLEGKEVHCGVTSLPGVLIGRWLGPDAAALRRSFGGFVARFRHAVAGLPARPPAGWST